MGAAKVMAFVVAGTLAVACGSSSATSATSTTATTTSAPAGQHSTAAFEGLEQQFGATLGVYAVDTGSGATVTYRADRRFAFCSTYKALVAGVLLRRDTDAELATVVTYTSADLLAYAPITSQHLATGMSVDDLISAAIRQSDNTAANLLLAGLGGPSGLQSHLRGLGDRTTNVDRNEPAVNTAVPGDVRDTTTPRALATDLRRFALGDALTAARRAQLNDNLAGNTTGGPYIRAGVPTGWTVGDKTGNGDYGTRNDIAVVRPPGRKPIVIALLSNRAQQDSSSQDALLAEATKVIVTDLG
jgi:beta-lactamase class A